MDQLILRVIQQSKIKAGPLSARQIFFREFDRALRLASVGHKEAADEHRLLKLMQYGLEAGLSSAEWENRKQTLIWALRQAA